MIDKQAESTQSLEKGESLYSKILFEGIRVSIIGTIVSATLFPGDMLLFWLHRTSAASIASTTTAKTSFYAMLASFVRHFPEAISAFREQAFSGIKKNTVISQRENANQLLNGKVNEEHGPNQQGSVLWQNFLVALVLGLVDTSLTQSNSNYKIRLFERIRNPYFVFPDTATFFDRLKALAVGYPIRLSKSFTIISAYIIQPTVQNKIDQRFSQALNGYSQEASSVVTAVLVGGLASIYTNGAEIVYKTQIARTDPKTIAYPNVWQVAKDLIKEEGVKTIRRGLFTSFVYSTVGLYMMPKAERIADKAVHCLRHYKLNFFKPTPNTVESDDRAQSSFDNEAKTENNATLK
jgi:hypothetical protein